MVSATAALAALTSCHRGAANTPPDAKERPLAVYAAQRVILTPTAHVRTADSLGWVQQFGGARAVARSLDTNIVAVLDARGLASRWVLPAELTRAFERNRTYAADPYQLVVQPLRAPSFKTGARFGEPLSSQLRTMIALHEDARFVMIPVEVSFEPDHAAGVGAGRALLRIAVLDPRFAEAKWVGDVKGDAASTPTLALSSAATRLVDLFVAP